MSSLSSSHFVSSYKEYKLSELGAILQTRTLLVFFVETTEHFLSKYMYHREYLDSLETELFAN